MIIGLVGEARGWAGRRAGPPRQPVAHGHFHVAGEAVVRVPEAEHDTTIWSLAANGDPANVRLLDLATLSDPT